MNLSREKSVGENGRKKYLKKGPLRYNRKIAIKRNKESY